MQKIKLALAFLGMTLFSHHVQAESSWDSQDLTKLPTVNQGKNAAIFEVKYEIDAYPVTMNRWEPLRFTIQEGKRRLYGDIDHLAGRCTLSFKHEVHGRPLDYKDGQLVAPHFQYKPTFLRFKSVKRMVHLGDYYELKITRSRHFDKLYCQPAHGKSNLTIGEVKSILNGEEFQLSIPAP